MYEQEANENFEGIDHRLCYNKHVRKVLRANSDNTNEHVGLQDVRDVGQCLFRALAVHMVGTEAYYQAVRLALLFVAYHSDEAHLAGMSYKELIFIHYVNNSSTWSENPHLKSDVSVDRKACFTYLYHLVRGKVYASADELAMASVLTQCNVVIYESVVVSDTKSKLVPRATISPPDGVVPFTEKIEIANTRQGDHWEAVVVEQPAASSDEWDKIGKAHMTEKAETFVTPKATHRSGSDLTRSQGRGDGKTVESFSLSDAEDRAEAGASLRERSPSQVWFDDSEVPASSMSRSASPSAATSSSSDTEREQLLKRLKELEARKSERAAAKRREKTRAEKRKLKFHENSLESAQKLQASAERKAAKQSSQQPLTYVEQQITELTTGLAQMREQFSRFMSTSSETMHIPVPKQQSSKSSPPLISAAAAPEISQEAPLAGSGSEIHESLDFEPVFPHAHLHNSTDSSAPPAAPPGLSDASLDQTLLSPAVAGSNRIEIPNSSAFTKGQQVLINPGQPTQEVHVVVAFGSLILRDNLKYDHRAGEVVRPANGEPVSGAEQPVVPNDARPAVVPDAQLLDSVIIQNLKGVTELKEFPILEMGRKWGVGHLASVDKWLEKVVVEWQKHYPHRIALLTRLITNGLFVQRTYIALSYADREFFKPAKLDVDTNPVDKNLCMLLLPFFLQAVPTFIRERFYSFCKTGKIPETSSDDSADADDMQATVAEFWGFGGDDSDNNYGLALASAHQSHFFSIDMLLFVVFCAVYNGSGNQRTEITKSISDFNAPDTIYDVASSLDNWIHRVRLSNKMRLIIADPAVLWSKFQSLTQLAREHFPSYAFHEQQVIIQYKLDTILQGNYLQVFQGMFACVKRLDVLFAANPLPPKPPPKPKEKGSANSVQPTPTPTEPKKKEKKKKKKSPGGSAGSATEKPAAEKEKDPWKTGKFCSPWIRNDPPSCPYGDKCRYPATHVPITEKMREALKNKEKFLSERKSKSEKKGENGTGNFCFSFEDSADDLAQWANFDLAQWANSVVNENDAQLPADASLFQLSEEDFEDECALLNAAIATGGTPDAGELPSTRTVDRVSFRKITFENAQVEYAPGGNVAISNWTGLVSFCTYQKRVVLKNENFRWEYTGDIFTSQGPTCVFAGLVGSEHVLTVVTSHALPILRERVFTQQEFGFLMSTQEEKFDELDREFALSDYWHSESRVANQVEEHLQHLRSMPGWLDAADANGFGTSCCSYLFSFCNMLVFCLSFIFRVLARLAHGLVLLSPKLPSLLFFILGLLLFCNPDAFFQLVLPKYYWIFKLVHGAEVHEGAAATPFFSNFSDPTRYFPPASVVPAAFPATGTLMMTSPHVDWWCLDSGASHHHCDEQDMLEEDLRLLKAGVSPRSINVSIANGSSFEGLLTPSREIVHKPPKAATEPGSRLKPARLLSVGRLLRQGCRFSGAANSSNFPEFRITLPDDRTHISVHTFQNCPYVSPTDALTLRKLAFSSVAFSASVELLGNSDRRFDHFFHAKGWSALPWDSLRTCADVDLQTAWSTATGPQNFLARVAAQLSSSDASDSSGICFHMTTLEGAPINIIDKASLLEDLQVKYKHSVENGQHAPIRKIASIEKIAFLRERGAFHPHICLDFQLGSSKGHDGSTHTAVMMAEWWDSEKKKRCEIINTYCFASIH